MSYGMSAFTLILGHSDFDRKFVAFYREKDRVYLSLGHCMHYGVLC